MLPKQENLRQSIIIGWIALIQLVVVMFIVAIYRGAIANDFTGFVKDPGSLGIDIMIVVFTIYALVPVLVRAIDWRVFRWFMVGISVFFLLFFIAHQLTHMIVDNTQLNLYHVLDFAHHFLMLWIIACTIRWARHRGE
jgi:hypothetical protein